MLKVSCLLFDTELSRELHDLVSYIDYTYIAKGKDANIGNIYNEITKAGIEVDLETIGHIYNNVLPKDIKQVMSDEDVNTFVLRNYNDAIQRAAKLEDKEGEQKIGEDAPDRHLVIGLLNMFTNANVADNRTQSDMLKMQEALWKGVQRSLNLKDNQKPQTKEQWKEVINRALGYEQLGIRDLNGRLNSIKDLYTSMQEQLKEAGKELIRKGDYAEVQRWYDMVDTLEAQTYSLLFSKGEAKELLDSMMKEAGFGKTLSNGKIIKDWNKLAGEVNSVQDIRANVQRVLEDNGFNADVIEGVKNSLQNEFEELQAESLRQQIENKKKMSSEISKDIIDNAINKVIGMPLSQWIDKGNLETLRQIREAAKKELVDAKYTTELKVAIVNRIADFFENKYAKLETIEAKNAVNVLTNGKGALDWIKKNGIQNKSELALKLNNWLSGRNISDSQKQNIRSEFQRIMEFEVKAEKDLLNREKASDREVVNKTDLKRLAELNNLGIFESAHDRLLNNLIGVSDLQQQDIADLKELADAASALYKHIDKNYGNSIFASHEFQNLQNKVGEIIGRNINNKTRRLKIYKIIDNIFNVYLTGLLSTPFTLLENFWSGFKEIVAPSLLGSKSVSKESLRLYWHTLVDVTKRGIPYGEEVGNFAPRDLYLNSLKWKWKDSTHKEKLESILYAATIPARVGLLAIDSANKVLIDNKTFKNVMYQGLVQNGMSKEQALKEINEALYGQSFEQAKEDAKKMIELANSYLADKNKTPINEHTIFRLANDLVKANLNLGGKINTDFIEAAMKGSYHVAGKGLGHESNNYVSERIKLQRTKWATEEAKLIKQKKWDELAAHRFKSMWMNNIITKFAAGASNWVYLRYQSGFGLGVAVGYFGKWDNDIDFGTKEEMQESIQKIHNDRNAIGRGLVGISANVLAYLVGYLIYGSDDDEEKTKRLLKLQELEKQGYLTKYQKENLTSEQKVNIKSKLQEEKKQLEKDADPYKGIKDNYMLSRLFKKIAPDAMLLHFYMNTEPNKYLGVLNYIMKTSGLGNDFSLSSKMADAATMYYRGNFDAGNGILAQYAGNTFGVPLWKSVQEWSSLVEWIVGGDVSSNYKQPTDIMEGFFGGGMLEDLGFYNRDSKITNLPGIGGKTYEKFKARGIERMSDLEKNPDWYNMKYKNESGEMVYIMDATSRKKAKDAAEKWLKQN